MRERFKINIEEIMEKISILATILMAVVSIYNCCADIKRDSKKLVNRDKSEGS